MKPTTTESIDFGNHEDRMKSRGTGGGEKKKRKGEAKNDQSFLFSFGKRTVEC
jgi:hypothetical protein